MLLTNDEDAKQMIKTLVDGADNKATFNMDMIQKGHARRFAHNKLPYEFGTYIQFAKNPCVQNQFFSVQAVTRAKRQVLFEPENHGDLAKQQTQAVMKGLVTNLFAGNQTEIKKLENFPDQDHGNHELNFKYEYLTSDGPRAADTFKDPGHRMTCLGSGEWKVIDTEEAYTSAERAEGKAPETREYLIISKWFYDD